MRILTSSAISAAALCLALAAGGAAARLDASPAAQQAAQGSAEPTTLKATLSTPKGSSIGHAELTDTPAGVLVKLVLTNAPAGTHAFHIHETGRCEAPDFQSAGGHFNPTKAAHGFYDAEGPHAGDLPNLHIPQNGTLTVEMLADGVTLRSGSTSLLDADGAALVLHQGADDYRTEPAGGAQSRVACGVVQRSAQ